MSRRPVSRDANHAEVVDHLRAYGVDVTDMSAVGTLPDILVAYGTRDGRFGFAGWIEIKVPGPKANFTWRQLKWISDTRYPIAIVTTKEQALSFATSLGDGGLTQKQKDALAVFCMQNDRKAIFTATQIFRVIAERR